MMKRTAAVRITVIVMFSIPVSLFWGCDGGGEEETVYERIHRKESERTDGTEDKAGKFRDLPATVLVKTDTDQPDFRTLERTSHLKRYPCSGCHKSGERVRSTDDVNPGDRRAHWKQTLDHGGEEDMDCSTCHGSEPEDQLETPRGKPVPFDRPDNVCRSCHGKQVRDWKGGAHGKQYKYWDWSEEPVRYNCTTCHDPHDPSFEQRWPATYPRLPEGGKK